jgi:hypothetical protein
MKDLTLGLRPRNGAPGNPEAAVTARMLNCHHATLYRLLNNIVAIIDEEFDDEKRR